MRRPDASRPVERPGWTREESGLLLAVCLSTALVPLNSTMIAVALPDVARDLRVEPADGLVMVTSYLVVAAAVQPVAGALGDHFGRRRTVLGGTVAFGVFSIATAMAASLPLLVVLRCLQAAAGAVALPNAAASVREGVPQDRRGRALGVVAAAATLAAAAGPPLGGLLTESAGWRAVFLVNVPLAAAAAVASRVALPRTVPRGSSRFDLLGALLLLVGLGGGATLLTVRPTGMDLLVGAAAVAVAWLALVPHELRTCQPVLDPRLLLRRPVAAAALAVAGSNLTLYVLLLAVPVLIVGEQGEAAVGVLLLPLLGTICLLSPVGGRLSDQVGGRTPAVAGTGLLSATMLVLLLLPGRMPGLPVLVVALGLAGAGLGIAMAPVQASAFDAVEPARAGMVAGAWSTSRYLGSISGSAALAALWRDQPAAPEPVFLLGTIGAVVSFLAVLVLDGRRGARGPGPCVEERRHGRGPSGLADPALSGRSSAPTTRRRRPCRRLRLTRRCG